MMVSRRNLLTSLPGLSLLGTAGFFQVATLGEVGDAGDLVRASGAGSAPGLLPPKLSDVYHARDFGAVGDGIADDTDALVNLLAAMQKHGKPGLLGGNGPITRYAVKAGTLRWSGTSTTENAAGPVLYTAGRVVLRAAAGSANAPLLYIHNEPSAGGGFIHGGYLGPIEFEDLIGDVARSRHALQLCGVEQMHFGTLFSQALQGDLVHIEQKGEGTTGDSWHVFGNIFEGLIAWKTSGWALNNDSLSQFFNGNQIGTIWKVQGSRGAWRGAGAANYCRMLSVFACSGWAIDWAGDSGSTQFNTIEFAELDAPEFGVRLDGPQMASIRHGRVVHRYEGLSDPLHGQPAAWPKVVVQVGGKSRQASSDCELRFFNYIREGVTDRTDSYLGNLTDFANDPTVHRNRIEHVIAYSAGAVSYDPRKFLVNLNSNAHGNDVLVNGKSVVRAAERGALVARITSGRIPQTFAERLKFPSIELDQGGNYDLVKGEFIVPGTAVYRLHLQLMLAPAHDEPVKLGFVVSDTLIREAHYLGQGTGAQTFTLDTITPLHRNDRVAVVAACQSRPSFSGGTSAVEYCNRLEIFHL